MFKFFPYMLKTLWQHRTRSLLTINGAGVAMFVFCVMLAVQSGLDALTRQNEAVLVVFQANKFCPATSHLPQDYDRQIARIDGVTDVVPIQVFTNNCRASLDVVVFYGVPADKVRKVRDFTLREGSWPAFEDHQDAALVGRTLAERRGIKPGEKFSIGDVTVTVAGIFESQNRAEEDYVYCHLDFLQRTRGLDLVGTVTQHEVFLSESAAPTEVAARIDEWYQSGPVQTDTRTKGAFQASSLQDVIQLIGLSRYLGYACLGLMVVLLSTTTIMTVEDRIQEHAVLQTLGFTGRSVFRLVLGECVLLSLAGGLLGIGLAWLALSVGRLSLGAEAVTIAFVPTPFMVWSGILTTAGVGVLAGLIPAWREPDRDRQRTTLSLTVPPDCIAYATTYSMAVPTSR